MNNLRFTGEHIQCWNPTCPRPELTEKILAGDIVDAIELLTEVVTGAGRPYISDRQDWVDIQVDMSLWELLQQWLTSRKLGTNKMLPELIRGERRADVWAQQFCLMFPAPDEETMLAWFSGAIMAGYDWGVSVVPDLLITRTRLEELCEISHDEYERQAEIHGWKTQEASRVPWSDVPEANKETVRASLMAVIKELGLSVA